MKLFSPKTDCNNYVVPIIRLIVCAAAYTVGIWLYIAPPDELIAFWNEHWVYLRIPAMILIAGYAILPILVSKSITEILYAKDNILAQKAKDR